MALHNDGDVVPVRMPHETLAQTVERVLPHICRAGKGDVVVDQLEQAIARDRVDLAGRPRIYAERAAAIRALIEDGETRNVSAQARALDGLARSWELDDPACQALALADAQVWATLHLAEVTANPPPAPPPALTDKERDVLIGAILNVFEIRGGQGRRVQLLQSAADKLGLDLAE